MLITRLAVLATLAAPMFAGSFMISLRNPAAADPEDRGGLVTVQLSNHVGPADNGLLEVTAEGLIDSERVTMPGRLVRLKDPTLSAIHWSRPAKGALGVALQDWSRSLRGGPRWAQWCPAASSIPDMERNRPNEYCARVACSRKYHHCRASRRAPITHRFSSAI